MAYVQKTPVGPTVEEALERASVQGCSAWPALRQDPAAFLAYLAERVDDPSQLAKLHIGDLYLAFACSKDDPAAHAAFDEHVLSQVSRHVAHVGRDAAFVDEVRQAVRNRVLLARSDEPAAVCEYTGRGPLAGWIRIVATRLALNLRRADERWKRRERLGEALPIAAAPDPERDYLRHRLGTDLRRALEATVAELSREERGVLRMHYLDGLNIDAIAEVQRVHRATIARWIGRARARILAETRRRLAEAEGVSSEELDSAIALARSRLDINLSSLLRAT